MALRDVLALKMQVQETHQRLIDACKISQEGLSAPGALAGLPRLTELQEMQTQLQLFARTQISDTEFAAHKVALEKELAGCSGAPLEMMVATEKQASDRHAALAGVWTSYQRLWAEIGKLLPALVR